MPINPVTLKALIDTQITNETVDFAITPAEVGGRLKDAIDYTTEQISGTQVTKTIKITLSAAQILSLNAIPIQILPAAAGKIYIPRFVFQNYTHVSVNYASSATLKLAYDNTSLWVLQFNLFSPFNNSGQGLNALNINGASIQSNTYSGKSLIMFLTSEMFDGNGTSEIYLTYDEITL